MNAARTPPEILHEILHYVDFYSLPAFRSASRQFRDTALEFLYAKVWDISRLAGHLGDECWRTSGAAEDLPVCQSSGCYDCNRCYRYNNTRCILCSAFQRSGQILVHNLPVQQGFDQLVLRLNLMTEVALHFTCKTARHRGVVHMSKLIAALCSLPAGTVFVKARTLDIRFTTPHASLAASVLKLFLKHPRLRKIKVRSEGVIPSNVAASLLKILEEEGHQDIELELGLLPELSGPFWKSWSTLRSITSLVAHIDLHNAPPVVLRATYSHISQLPCLTHLRMDLEGSVERLSSPTTPYAFPFLVSFEIRSSFPAPMLDTLTMFRCPRLSTICLVIEHPPFLDPFHNILSAVLLSSSSLLEELSFTCEYDIEGELDPEYEMPVMRVDDNCLAPLFQMKNLTTLTLDPELRVDAITDKFLSDVAASLPALNIFVLGKSSLYSVVPCATVSGIQAVLESCLHLQTFHVPFKLGGTLVLQEVLLGLKRFGSLFAAHEPDAVLFHTELVRMRPGLERITVGYDQNLKAVTPGQEHLASEQDKHAYVTKYRGCSFENIGRQVFSIVPRQFVFAYLMNFQSIPRRF
ncbi:hypothetical protein CPB83DRAFT_899316 [Crepidotus variabilis]|uniref:F-box domain-containing protein n=1 Tax=Crepidotus variabilis TaxID=179855 RepID=A0A9P6JJ14_9AGAR|nr:hypothetical protein CPB83DRAFT_899316 [Crepidotus variabilis]